MNMIILIFEDIMEGGVMDGIIVVKILIQKPKIIQKQVRYFMNYILPFISTYYLTNHFQKKKKKKKKISQRISLQFTDFFLQQSTIFYNSPKQA